MSAASSSSNSKGGGGDSTTSNSWSVSSADSVDDGDAPGLRNKPRFNCMQSFDVPTRNASSFLVRLVRRLRGQRRCARAAECYSIPTFDLIHYKKGRLRQFDDSVAVGDTPRVPRSRTCQFDIDLSWQQPQEQQSRDICGWKWHSFFSHLTNLPRARSARAARSESLAASRGSTRSRNFWLEEELGSNSMHLSALMIILQETRR